MDAFSIGESRLSTLQPNEMVLNRAARRNIKNFMIQTGDPTGEHQ